MTSSFFPCGKVQLLNTLNYNGSSFAKSESDVLITSMTTFLGSSWVIGYTIYIYTIHIILHERFRSNMNSGMLSLWGTLFLIVFVLCIACTTCKKKKKNTNYDTGVSYDMTLSVELKYSNLNYCVFTLHFHLVIFKMLIQTRTTRMPAFWEYPLPPHDYPYYGFISDPMS